MADTSSMSVTAPSMVGASVAGRPNKSAVMSRPVARAVSTPMATPITTSIMDSPITRRDHVRTARAERHADPDFIRAPRHAVRHQAKEAHRRDQHGERPEHRVRLREHALLLQVLVDLIGLRRDVKHRQIRIDLPHRLPDRVHRRRGIRRRADVEHRRRPCLQVRDVHRRWDLVADALVFRVAQHADDLELRCSAQRSCRNAGRADARSGKYLRTAVSLITTTFGAVWLSRSVKPRPLISGISIVLKKSGEICSRLMLSNLRPSSGRRGRVHAVGEQGDVRDGDRAHAGNASSLAVTCSTSDRRLRIVVSVERGGQSEEHEIAAG